jgi:hypothetical protein
MSLVVCRSKSTLTDLRTSFLAFAAAQWRAVPGAVLQSHATFDRRKDGQRDTERAGTAFVYCEEIPAGATRRAHARRCKTDCS